MTPIVAAAVIWRWLYQPDFGAINWLLWELGVDEGPRWLTDPGLALPSLMLIGALGQRRRRGDDHFPGRPAERAAGTARGRGDRRRQCLAALPQRHAAADHADHLLQPGDRHHRGAQGVRAARSLATQGGPNYATWFFNLHLYNTAFQFFEMGYASALAWIFFVLVVALTVAERALVAQLGLLRGRGARMSVASRDRRRRRGRALAQTGERSAWYVGRGILYALAALGAILFMGPFSLRASGLAQDRGRDPRLSAAALARAARARKLRPAVRLPVHRFAPVLPQHASSSPCGGHLGTVLSACRRGVRLRALPLARARLLLHGPAGDAGAAGGSGHHPEVPDVPLRAAGLFGHTWIDTWWPLIVPSWFGGGAFNVFLLRQFFLQIPRDLDEAAMIDGANSWQILWSISCCRSAQPALATVAIFSFLTHWNDFFHPLIYLSTVEKLPALGRAALVPAGRERQSEPREHLLMAASMLMVLPCVVIFFTMQRYFVRGIVMSGIKG